MMDDQHNQTDEKLNTAQPQVAVTNPDRRWLEAKFSLRSELKFDTRTDGETAFVVIEDPVRSKFFQVGVAEFEFIAALDGQQTTAQVVQKMRDCHGNTIDAERAIKICQWMTQANLIQTDSIDSAKRLGGHANAISKQKRLGWLNPISIKINLLNPDPFLKFAEPYTRWAFSKWSAIVWCVAALYAVTIVWQRWDDLGNASIGILSGTRWIYMLVFWVMLKIAHEFAHGVTCRRYGGEVPEAGVLLLLFTPMAFVNVTSMWRFSNRWQRIAVAAAGMYIELFISFLALITWSVTDGMAADMAYDVFLMASVTTILFNANPLMRFDGYFILSDLLGVPNLYAKANVWFADRLKHHFWGTPKTPQLFAKREGKIIRTYGVFAYFWKLSVSLGLIIAASVLFDGAGVVLGVLGTALFFGLPIVRQIKAHFSKNSKLPASGRRVVFSSALLAGFVVAAFGVLKAPAIKSAPAVIHFADETIMRAKSDGFVKKILVASGQKVTRGQRLAELQNDDLAIEVQSLEAEIAAAEIQTRIHRQQNEMSLCQIEQEKLDGLRSQLAEKQSEVSGLAITSPIDGIVFQRNLDQAIGQFVRRGDELLTVARDDTKEMLVSIDQKDMESIKGLKNRTVQVMLPGRVGFRSVIKKINPRASDIPSDERMGAHAGGPLPVKPETDGGRSRTPMVLLEPRFTIEVAIDSGVGQRLHSGQRGQVFFKAKTQSMGSYLFLATNQWLKNKIEMATQTAAF